MKNKSGFLSVMCILVLFLFNGSASITGPDESLDYDVLIKNGRVFDGSLKDAFPADIAVKEGKIVRVARAITGKAARVIDARGFFVTPGFIDIHTHVDKAMYFPENRACLDYLTQGVTTVVVGQCGSSAWPIFESAQDQINRWTEEGIGPNAALLVGHGTVRQLVMGMENREPTPEELEKMKALVKEAMEQGACGISTGLIYLPGTYAKTAEIIELAKVVALYGGIYHSHIRNERDRIQDSVRELIEISEKSGVRGHISHFKVVGKSNWGLSKEACVLVEEARAKGLKITADQYPYRFANTVPYSPLIPRGVWTGVSNASELRIEDIERIFDTLRDSELIDLYSRITPYFPLSEPHLKFLNRLPRKELVSLVARELMGSALSRGPENERERMLFLKRMNDPLEAQKIRQGIKSYIENVGPENIMVGMCVERNLEGKSLKEIAVLKKKSLEDTAIELELMGAKAVPFFMTESDIEYFMKKDYVASGSDGIAPYYGIDFPHVRSYSTFLYKIKEYPLKRKMVSLAHVIRSQTSLPAEIMNWSDRGRIREGCKADIVVLDLKNIRVPSSISNPHQYSEGVVYLLINGTPVIDKGSWNGKLPGEVIRLKK
ncbi:MAG: D-aminoacylase [Candidatus Aminicenantales bacterium]